MSSVAWEFIKDQAESIKETRMDEMKLLAKQYKTIESNGLPGYKVTIKPEYLLNGDLIVRVEASRKRVFGFFTHLISGGFEVSYDGKITDYAKPIKTIECTSVRERWEAMSNS